MTDAERDRLIYEMHTDIKWLKDNWKELNKYKLMCIAALFAAIIGVII